MTIVEFLNARLDEDEATTRRQAERWYVCNDGHVATPTAQWDDGTDRLPNHHNTWDVMYDPERARADIAAKRAIVARCGREVRQQELNPRRYDFDTSERHALRALASVYADHPDYSPEWAA